MFAPRLKGSWLLVRFLLGWGQMLCGIACLAILFRQGPTWNMWLTAVMTTGLTATSRLLFGLRA